MNSEYTIFSLAPSDFNPVMECAACYIEWDNQLLLLQSAAHKKEPFTWGVAAGKMEKRETPLEAVIREVQEESGIELEIDDVLYLGPLFIRLCDLDFIYHMFTSVFKDVPQVRLSNEHVQFMWCDVQKITDIDWCTAGKEAYMRYRNTLLNVKVGNRNDA